MVAFQKEIRQTSKMTHLKPKVLSGDGKSPETAVVFEPSGRRSRVAAEHDVICDQFGVEDVHWTRQIHLTSFDLQSVWTIELEGGSQTSVYFETENTIEDD